MNLLFSGGCGYIGSHTAYEFLKNTQAKIVLLDNLSTGFRETFEYLNSKFPNRVSLFEVSLQEVEKIDAFLRENYFDCVIHFAASIIVSESVCNPLKYYLNNTLNTTNLINLCIQHKIKNFIFSSTAAVYGEPSVNPVVESTQTDPINPYGSSKLMSEWVLRDTALAHDFNYIALRYFNVAGSNVYNTPNELADAQGLGQRSLNATHLIKVASECAIGIRESMGIYGDDYSTPDGTCIRDYLHINDLARAHLSAYDYLLREQKSNTFNVGYNKGYSVKEVIATMKKVTGIDFKVKISPRREGDPAILIAGNDKLLAHTSWKPLYNDLELICKSSYEWEKNLRNKV
ncbi:UDP-glucose 4-epimerase GalE [Helicobacter cholecystus]|uniref:UDP-glucose 4-epimerase GalE n=1 Tax=Helicobacter cholecystus TaxID=45498 RepID=UPI002739BA01|nr:UDP-glucose 4-epimerase GalE [Helicobacter cholecystus]